MRTVNFGCSKGRRLVGSSVRSGARAGSGWDVGDSVTGASTGAGVGAVGSSAVHGSDGGDRYWTEHITDDAHNSDCFYLGIFFHCFQKHS